MKKRREENMAKLFPTIHGKNLNKEKVIIPDNFLDKNIIIIVAFQRWHQELVDKTIKILESNGLDQSHDIIEIPIIQKTSWFRQVRLDTIMRLGITDYNIRKRTITVYLDKKDFRDKLDIPDEETIHWFLVEHYSKNILLKGIGIISNEEIRKIMNKLS